MKEGSLQSKVFQGAICSAVESWAGFLLRMVYLVVLARLIGAEGFGLFALAVLFAGLAGFFVHLGIPAALVQKQELNEIQIHSAFWVLGLTSAILTLATIACAGDSADFSRKTTEACSTGTGVPISSKCDGCHFGGIEMTAVGI